MADGSNIEWTDATWNPLRVRIPAQFEVHGGSASHRDDGPHVREIRKAKVGWHCEHVTSACGFCYAEGINKRLGTGLPFKPGHRKDLEFFLDEKTLLQPLHWRRPRKIFVGSMTDLFGDWVTDEQLDRIFAVMALCPQHTFQVLTKRPERMRDYFAGVSKFRRNPEEIEDREQSVHDAIQVILRARRDIDIRYVSYDYPKWPLPNVWLGVSCEDQATADERIPILLDTPAAVRFISAEPLLGKIDLENLPSVSGIGRDLDALRNAGCEFADTSAKLDWVIAGGESGSRARPMHPDWARSLRDQCQAAGVAFFFKQWGEWLPGAQYTDAHRARDPGEIVSRFECRDWNGEGYEEADEYEQMSSGEVYRVGKKAAGRLLDGVEHSVFPGGHGPLALSPPYGAATQP